MVTATLRKPTTASTVSVAPPSPAIDISAQVVEVNGVRVECTNTVAPSANLEDIMLPPAVSNDNVAPGCEQFSTQPPAAGAVTFRPPSAVARPQQNYNTAGVEGEWGSDDLKFPQLKQVQGSGPLSTQFDNGTIIYGDTELLPPPSMKEGAKNTPIRFVPISLTKQFREKLSQEDADAGEMPRVVNTVQEVEALGGTTRWVGDDRPANYWEPSARCMFLLELPEGCDHPGFALQLDGKSYAVAIYYAAGGAFRDSAKIIFNTTLTSLLVPVLGADGQPEKTPRGQIVKKPMLWKNFWLLNFAKKQAGNFTPWRPIVKLLPKEETGPEVRAYCEQLVAGSAEAAA